MFRFTPIKHKGAKAAVTALKHYWSEQGIDFRCNERSLISKVLKGYQDLKPSDKRPTKPFSYFHLMKVIEKGLINTKCYAGKSTLGILSFGYFYGGRVGEYSPKSRSEWKLIIQRGDIEFIYKSVKRKKVISIIADFKEHKANRFGLWDAKISVDCVCGSMRFCPIHSALLPFISARDAIFGNDPDVPLFMQLNGMPISQTHMRNLMKNLARGLGLNEKFYVPHSLRSGRCTDLVRARKPNWAIKKWGRWRSDCWLDHYLKLDVSDISKITNLTYNDLGIQDSTIVRY